MQNVSLDPWYYEQTDLGFNYRLTDIQAALGYSQLDRLDQFVTQRQQLAANYDKYLVSLPIVLPFQHPDSYSAVHLYVIQLDPENSPLNRRALFEHLRERGVGVNVHYIPVHTQPYYRRLNVHKGPFIEAEKYYANAITLPLFFDLEKEQQFRVVELLHKALKC